MKRRMRQSNFVMIREAETTVSYFKVLWQEQRKTTENVS